MSQIRVGEGENGDRSQLLPMIGQCVGNNLDTNTS